MDGQNSSVFSKDYGLRDFDEEIGRTHKQVEEIDWR
jgi:hypothetical protein